MKFSVDFECGSHRWYDSDFDIHCIAFDLLPAISFIRDCGQTCVMIEWLWFYVRIAR